MLRPHDPDYARYLPTYNLRVARAPAVRALCSTEAAVAGVVNWVRTTGQSFATRSGGHSFEGYSESSGVVIDVRGLSSVKYDAATGALSAGAGASLHAIYAALPAGVAFAAGTCPTVGIAGHVLGGGLGLAGRAFGFACDNLLALWLVDARGRVLAADATHEADLFWACRGGGGGSLGIATRFTFRTHAVGKVIAFGVTWSFTDMTAAAGLIDAWQRWAPSLAREISALLKVSKLGSGKLQLRCVGQSLARAADLQRELAKLTAIAAPDGAPTLAAMTFAQAVKHFAGTDNELGKYYTKEKSDFALLLSPNAIATLLSELMALGAGRVLVILYALGGAIRDVAPAGTAFPHRNANCLIHYFGLWDHPSVTAARLRNIARVYAAMRPHVPDWSYVNYPDGDLANPADAYWAGNLPRLKALKRQYDPNDLFHFSQSIPL